MQEQNFKNHVRYVPLFHFVMLGIVIAIVALSVKNLFYGVTISSILFLLIAIAFLIGFVVFRQFPLAAQDRAIRAEENLRYFSITGRLFDSKLTLGQIIALRFASDEELVELADRAIKENMSNKEIKMAIKNWRADHHRA
jgi:hypothetical protein